MSRGLRKCCVELHFFGSICLRCANERVWLKSSRIHQVWAQGWIVEILQVRVRQEECTTLKWNILDSIPTRCWRLKLIVQLQSDCASIMRNGGTWVLRGKLSSRALPWDANATVVSLQLLAFLKRLNLVFVFLFHADCVLWDDLSWGISFRLPGTDRGVVRDVAKRAHLSCRFLIYYSPTIVQIQWNSYVVITVECYKGFYS